MYGLRNEFKIAFEHNLCTYFNRPSSLEIAFNIAAINAQLKLPSSKSTVADASSSSAKSDASAKKSTLTSGGSGTKGSPTGENKSERSNMAGTGTGNGSSPKAIISDQKPSLSSLDYAQRYYPANYRRLEKEMNELRLFIERCHEKDIKLVLINMPVSSGHPSISPPGLRDRYLRELRNAANKADLYLDYDNNGIFSDTDFFDTVHLNPNGAQKFIDDLVTKYAQSSHR